MKTLIMLIAMMISFGAYATDCDIVVTGKDVVGHTGVVEISDGSSVMLIVREEILSAQDIMSVLKDQVGELQQYTEWSWGNDKALVEEFKDHTRAYVYEPADYGLRQKAEVCGIEEVEFDL